MSEIRLDVLAIGDAVVDVIATADDEFLIQEGLVKGSMRVLAPEEATRLYAHMGPARETSGGSAANTMAGIAALGGKAGFVGLVAADQLGEVFAHDIRAQGVEFATPASRDGVPTGRCLILVTPDAQRTMNTFPGAAHRLSTDVLDHEQIRGAAILYLEAYLWRAEAPRAAMKAAMKVAADAGRKVAFTLSDIALIALHRQEFLDLIGSGAIDMLFANEAEARALAGTDDLDAAIAMIAPQVRMLVVTCGSRGAMAVAGEERASIPAIWIEEVVDTTGAGDLFAAGFLVGQAQGKSLEQSLRIGAGAAAEIISHFGARPEVDLRPLVEAA
ncbi:adenosine kinase [Allosphingosinicella vermicomposti]|uniref:adenosine kinase n=1 Tax=Allosphingosinicella vermicomposti TaxID=614671 RepID=UPI000D0F43D4|nr:adenosine kinase [Allosphingosinicella vermicomposti]